MAQLSARPLLTGMWSTATILFTGDVLAQQVLLVNWLRDSMRVNLGSVILLRFRC